MTDISPFYNSSGSGRETLPLAINVDGYKNPIEVQ